MATSCYVNRDVEGLCFLRRCSSTLVPPINVHIRCFSLQVETCTLWVRKQTNLSALKEEESLFIFPFKVNQCELNGTIAAPQNRLQLISLLQRQQPFLVLPDGWASFNLKLYVMPPPTDSIPHPFSLLIRLYP